MTEADACRYGDVLPRTKLETLVRAPLQSRDSSCYKTLTLNMFRLL